MYKKRFIAQNEKRRKLEKKSEQRTFHNITKRFYEFRVEILQTINSSKHDKQKTVQLTQIFISNTTVIL